MLSAQCSVLSAQCLALSAQTTHTHTHPLAREGGAEGSESWTKLSCAPAIHLIVIMVACDFIIIIIRYLFSSLSFMISIMIFISPSSPSPSPFQTTIVACRSVFHCPKSPGQTPPTPRASSARVRSNGNAAIYVCASACLHVCARASKCAVYMCTHAHSTKNQSQQIKSYIKNIKSY